MSKMEIFVSKPNIWENKKHQFGIKKFNQTSAVKQSVSAIL